ncbi:MAG: prenyltransferase [Methanobacteriaceae archaeon]|nr:prenyltransferase [Methanobacteriaceae archaeon]
MNQKDVIKILKLGRFHFLGAGFFSFTAGALLAVILNTPFSWERFILGYMVLFPAHLSVSYSNDYFDVDVDKHGQPTLFTGGSGILVENPHLRPFAKKFALFLISCSVIFSLIFTIYFNVPLFFIITIIGIFLAWYYSSPPLKLSYRGWGELAMVSTGFIVPSLGYLAISGYLDLQSVIFTLPLMFYQVLFIINVEIPDMESDLNGGKRTFIVNHGRKTGFKLIGISGAISTILFMLMGLSNLYKMPDFRLVALISLLPTVMGLWSFLNRTTEKKKATQLSTHTLASLFAFIIILNVYFLTLL